MNHGDSSELPDSEHTEKQRKLEGAVNYGNQLRLRDFREVNAMAQAKDSKLRLGSRSHISTEALAQVYFRR